MADRRKTVLITGCSPGGIGHALAREFNSQGLRVFATARRKETIEHLTTLGIETLSLEVDVPESVESARREIEGLTGGGLDYLVNNAGRSTAPPFFPPKPLPHFPLTAPLILLAQKTDYTVPALDIDLEEVASTFSVNVFAVMRMCQTFAPLLIASRGTIVQLGSLAGVMPYVFGSVYNASKAALHAYSDTLRIELAPFGVKVTTVITGGVRSNIARTDRTLPPTSLYLPVDAEYQRRTKHSQENAMPNEAYAKSVVTQVLGFWPRRYIWQGHFAWMAWFIDSFLPRMVWDMGFRWMFKLWKLEGTRAVGKKDV